MISSLLTNALTEQQLQIAPTQQEQLIAYLTLLQKWNRTYNLTSITNPKDMVYLHLLDSLIIQPYLQGTRLIDVGSGAGVPGMVLAITNPQQHWTLLDKNNKKTRFLTQVVAELGLNNVEVIQMKSEEFHPTTGFDSILSRAYGSLIFFQETTKHLRAHNGIYIALKGQYPTEEIAQLNGIARILKVVPLKLANEDAKRHLVIFTD